MYALHCIDEPCLYKRTNLGPGQKPCQLHPCLKFLQYGRAIGRIENYTHMLPYTLIKGAKRPSPRTPSPSPDEGEGYVFRMWLLSICLVVFQHCLAKHLEVMSRKMFWHGPRIYVFRGADIWENPMWEPPRASRQETKDNKTESERCGAAINQAIGQTGHRRYATP